jgi:hypothetical protein
MGTSGIHAVAASSPKTLAAEQIFLKISQRKLCAMVGLETFMAKGMERPIGIKATPESWQGCSYSEKRWNGGIFSV